MPTFDCEMATALVVSCLIGGRTGVCPTVCTFQMTDFQEGSIVMKREFVFFTSCYFLVVFEPLDADGM